MQNAIRADLETALQDFKQMIPSNTIPHKMQTKLLLLESAIMGTPREEALLDELPEFQRLSLQQMNRETQISLFVSIVKCLQGKEVVHHFKDEGATLRKEQSFSGWTSCFLTCDTNSITATKKKDSNDHWYHFLIERLWISKVYRLHKKRYIFGIAYDKKKYQLGFEEEATCAKIHGIVINLIRQRRNLRQKLRQVNQSQSNQSQLATELEFQKEEGIFQKDFDQEEIIQFQEKEYLTGVQASVQKMQLFDNANYELVTNIDKGRILQNKAQGSFKICLLMQRLSVETVLEKLLDFKQWNTQVQSFWIVSRIRSNTYLAYLKMKKYSLFTFPRETHLTLTFLKTCRCLTASNTESQLGKYYLLLNSLENETTSKGTVSMHLEQVIQLSSVQDSPNTIFMILWSKIDFKGYDYFNYNREMNLLFLNDFAHLTSYCQQKMSSSSSNAIFDLNYCACKIKRYRKGSTHSDVSGISFKSQEKEEKFKQSQSPFKKINVVSTIEKYHKGIRDDKIIEIIRKKMFQSYYFNHRFQLNAMSEQKLSKQGLEQERDFLLQAGKWKLNSGNLVFCDQQAIKAQKGILKMILKQMGSNLMAGKSIMNMSLPVEIFDTKSMLQIIANTMGYFPKFIREAATAKDTVEQMKYVTMSYVLLNSCFPNALKPFNPILGETFQGIIGGIPIFLEQISHHPPIASLFIKTADFETFGNFDIHIDLGLNSAHSKISYYFTVKMLKSKAEYVIRLADVEMGGISFGQPTLKPIGRGFVYEKVNDIYCEFSIGKDKKKVYEYSSKVKPNDLTGGIFKVTNTFGKKLLSMDRHKAFQGVKPDDIIQKYCHISGTWYGDVFFDNAQYKSLQKGPFPVRVERPVYLLPSDSLFRTDIIHKKWGQNDKSNQQKQILENLQRSDRKRRGQNSSNH